MAVQSLMDLPLNIVEEIMSKLPIKTILACRCVCKTLLDLTSLNSNPRFAAVHAQNATQSLIIHYGKYYPYVNLFDSQIDTSSPSGFSERKCRLNPIFKFPDFDRKSGYPVLVNACNGLLYFHETQIKGRSSLVCNPITKEYVWVPPQALGDNSNASSLWLGFSPISRVYKVVSFYSLLPAVKIGAHIHRVGGSSSTWRDIESTPLDNIYWESSYVFIDGIGYWICLYDPVLSRSPANFMLSFDFETEIFGKIDAPPGFDEESRRFNSCFMSIGHVGDSLCLMYNLDIWMMDKKLCEGGQWFKKLSLVDAVEKPLSGSCLKPLQLLSNGEILMLSDEIDLVCCDIKSNNFRSIHMESHINVVTFVPSFMSLQDML